MMKRTVLLAGAAALALPAAAAAAPQQLYMDPSHTQVRAQWDHFTGAPLVIMFRDVEGTIMYDDEDVASSSVEITLPISGIDSGVAPFDDHLKSGDFFEVETWPEATFTSTSIERTGDNTASLTGDLTIKDNTAPVTFEVTLLNDMPHPMSGGRLVGFTAETTLNRSEWGLGMFSPTVAEEVDLVISTELSDSPPPQ